MPTFAWALIFSVITNGPASVIDNIGSEKSCEALKAAVEAPKAKCVRYEIALQPR
jgi:hypothetical protein